MKNMIGKVTSTKMEKTAVVTVERRWRHPLYKKTVKRNKNYLAHDPIGVSQGELVQITQSKPISKLKRWVILKKVDKSINQPKKTKKSEKNYDSA